MVVVDTFAHIQKLLVVLNCLSILFYVVVENTNRIVGPTLVSYFSCSPASKSQHLIIFESPENSYISRIVYFFILSTLFFIGCAIQEWVFLDCSGRSVEKERKLYSMWLWGGHRFVVALSVEGFDLIFFSQGGPDSEGAIEVGIMVGCCTFGSALHNKNI